MNASSGLFSPGMLLAPEAQRQQLIEEHDPRRHDQQHRPDVEEHRRLHRRVEGEEHRGPVEQDRCSGERYPGERQEEASLDQRRARHRPLEASHHAQRQEGVGEGKRQNERHRYAVQGEALVVVRQEKVVVEVEVGSVHRLEPTHEEAEQEAHEAQVEHPLGPALLGHLDGADLRGKGRRHSTTTFPNIE